MARINARLAGGKTFGTEPADEISGTFLDDHIFAGGGYDIINAGLGNDVINGGAGADNIHGSFGNDTISYSNAAQPAGRDGREPRTVHGPRERSMRASTPTSASRM